MIDSILVPGVGSLVTAEEDAGSVADPGAAFDRLGRLALLAGIEIRCGMSAEPYGGNPARRLSDVVNCTRALREMLRTTRAVAEGRKLWCRRQHAYTCVPAWPIDAPVAFLGLLAGHSSVLPANGQQNRWDSATPVA